MIQKIFRSRPILYRAGHGNNKQIVASEYTNIEIQNDTNCNMWSQKIIYELIH